MPIQLKNRRFSYLVLIIKNKQWKHWKRFETQTAQGFGIFDVEGVFSRIWLRVFLGGTNVPRWIPSAREGDLKEEEMASHEDRKQKNARFWRMWLVGGFGQIENWQILAEFSTK